MATKKKQASRNLAHGRPPTLKRPTSISSKATKNLINLHHVLEKRKAQAQARGDQAAVTSIDAEISKLGGIEKYQQASLQGQRNDRGGDSSKVLIEWLKPITSQKTASSMSLRMLEVGALSTSNECSRSKLFDIERIDLNSQGEGILQQDFMKRPLPVQDSDRFDIISLSLVLNFVPDAQGRGDMLLRTLKFLKEPSITSQLTADGPFPSLFLVLPAPCVTNSRYMDEAHMEAIMNALGYSKVQYRLTQKLVYYLWKRQPDARLRDIAIVKKQIRTGSSRNNFSIVVRTSG